MESNSTLPSANHAIVIAQQSQVDPEGTRRRDLPVKHSNDKSEPEQRVRLRMVGRVGTPYGFVSYFRQFISVRYYFQIRLGLPTFPIDLYFVPCVQDNLSLVTLDLLYWPECDNVSRSNVYRRSTRTRRLRGHTTVAAGRYNRSRHGHDLTR